MMKKLPIGIQTFSKLIEQDLLYIDKTEQIYNLIQAHSYYFLSRPRRFGKSLLISTLKELFLGNKKLFKNLWIGSSDYDWQEYPVIHVDFGSIAHKNGEELDRALLEFFDDLALKNSIPIVSNTFSGKLKNIVSILSKKNRVVILIDEYDKPILDNLSDPLEAQAQQRILRSFYDTIKSLDEYLHAVFITGVSKCAKTSIFSGMNNLIDLTLSPKASLLLGYTEEEIKKYFTPYLQLGADNHKSSLERELENIKKWYNGYRFSESEKRVYNPFSVLYYSDTFQLRNYWFISGTPTFLIQYIKDQYKEIENIASCALTSSELGTFSLDDIPLVPLLFQTGYLTISDYDPLDDSYTLDFPNYEVELSSKQLIVSTLSYTQHSNMNTFCKQLIAALRIKDIAQFCTLLKILFAHIPYTLHIQKESYYHSLFQFLLSLLSLESQSELLTNKGRIDSVIILKEYIYIFELKLNMSSQKALDQIITKKYYERFKNQEKEIVLVGLSFITTGTVFDIEYALQEIIQK